ncbi:MAG: penicillin-binding protein 2 [Epsilonproteobacteria bacterium]|nr:penicillin-binding protein 2 [Campylobacterota bacterium]
MSDNQTHTLKIGILYALFLFVILIFLIRVLYISLHKPNYFTSTIISHTNLAIRGKIISHDNFVIAKNEKMYSVAVYPRYINPDKKELFINLLSIYSNTPRSTIKHLINTSKNRVILLKHIPYEIQKNLVYLSSVFAIKKVFLPTSKGIIYGLDIFEENSKRVTPFKDRLEPILGYMRNNQGMGLERYYNEILKPKQNGFIRGYRDVRNHIIYDNTVVIKPRIDGDDLRLNINLLLQGKIENMLDTLKTQLKAKEVLTVVMKSETGEVIAMASSNRYNPMHITQKDISHLKISHIQYTYEPGSVMKPITLSLLLKHHKVNIYEVLNAHNGVFYFKPRFTIYDDDSFKWLNVINAMIHSSNIVFAQLGLRLTPKEFREGLLEFGFNQKSQIDLPYEYKGLIFSPKEFLSEIHRASNSFGYGLRVNLIQLLKAYNVFNNNGIMIDPKIVSKYANTPLMHTTKRILSAANAQTVLNILRQVVLKGTGVAANIDGLFIAGKTGTAKISKNGKYIKGLYNSSFIGFANDDTHKYTIATLVIQPDKKHFFASQTAVVGFRNIVNIMLDMGLLKRHLTQ